MFLITLNKPSIILKEFACHCKRPECKFTYIDPDLLELVDKIQTKANVPIIINDGFRCKEHNQEVGGEIGSQHLLGKAADIHAVGMNSFALHSIADEIMAKSGGLGLYDTFIHVDVRSWRARWDLSTHKQSGAV